MPEKTSIPTPEQIFGEENKPIKSKGIPSPSDIFGIELDTQSAPKLEDKKDPSEILLDSTYKWKIPGQIEQPEVKAIDYTQGQKITSDSAQFQKQKAESEHGGQQLKALTQEYNKGVEGLKQIDQALQQQQQKEQQLKQQLLNSDNTSPEYKILLDQYDQHVNNMKQVQDQGNKLLNQTKKYERAIPYISKSLDLYKKEEDGKTLDPIQTFTRGVWNATIPAIMSGIGSAVEAIGDLPGTISPIPGPSALDAMDMKITDAIGDGLRYMGKSLEAPIPSASKESIFDGDITPNKIANTAGSLIGSLASVIAPGGIAGSLAKGVSAANAVKASALASGFALAMDGNYKTAKDHGLSDDDAALVSLSVSAPQAALDMLGVGSILNKFPKGQFGKKLVDETIKNLSGKEITKQSIFEATDLGLKELVKSAGKGAAKTGGEEFITGAAQQAVETGVEDVYDKMKGEKVFGKEFFSLQNLKESIQGGILESLGGVVAGGALGNLNVNQTLYDKIREFKDNPEAYERFQAQIGSELKNGALTEQQASEIANNVKAVMEIDNVIPANISNNKSRLQAVNLLSERNSLSNEIEGKDEFLAQPIKERIDQINNDLSMLSRGEDITKLTPELGGAIPEVTQQVQTQITPNESESQKIGESSFQEIGSEKIGEESVNIEKPLLTEGQVTEQKQGAENAPVLPSREVFTTEDKAGNIYYHEKKGDEIINIKKDEYDRIQTELKQEQDAIKEGEITKNSQQQYQQVNEGGIPSGTSDSNIPEQSGEIQKEEVKKELEADIDNFEKTVFGNITKDNIASKEKKTSLIGALSNVQEPLRKGISYLGEKIDRVVERGLVSDNKKIQKLSAILNNSLRLGITPEVLNNSDQLSGRFNRALGDAINSGKIMRDLIKNDKNSLVKIHKVLDPEFYNKKSRTEYESELKQEIGEDAYKELEDNEISELYNDYVEKIGAQSGSKVELKDLTVQEKKLYDILRSTNDMIHKMNFVMGKISPETYAAKKGKYIARMYDAFEMPKDLQTEYGSSSKSVDGSLYKKAGDITQWKLDHKIQDPVYLTTKRLHQTLLNKAVSDYTDFIANDKKNLVSDSEKDGFAKLGKGYGALSDKYVANHIVQDLKGFFFTNKSTQALYDFLKSYDKNPIRQFYKKLFTVYNPGVQLGNVTGDNIFAFLVGVDPITLNKNLPFSIKEASNYGPTYRYLLEKGVLNTDLTKAELTNSLKTYSDEVDAASKSKTPLKAIAQIPQKVYGAMDDIYKIAAFKSLIDQGVKEDAAVKLVSNGFQNYKRTPKLYDFASKIPIVGSPFARWGADLGRIVSNSIKSRPLHTLAFLYSLGQLGSLASYLSGETEDERKIREGRPGAPKIPLPNFLGGDKSLEFKMGNSKLNLARFLSPIYIYSGLEDNDLSQAMMKFSPIPIDFPEKTTNPNGSLAVFIGKNINDPIWSWINPLVDSDFRGKPILDPNSTMYKESTLTDSEKTINALKFLSRAYVPYGKDAEAISDAIRGKEDYFGRFKTPTQAVLNFLGIKVDKYGEEQYKKTLEGAIRANSYIFVNNAKKINTIESDLENKKTTDLVAKKRMANVLEDQAELMGKMQSSIDMARKKMTKKEVENILSDIKGLDSAKKKSNIGNKEKRVAR